MAKNVEKRKKGRSQGYQILMRFLKNKGAVVGLTIVILLALVAIFADVIVDYDTVEGEGISSCNLVVLKDVIRGSCALRDGVESVEHRLCTACGCKCGYEEIITDESFCCCSRIFKSQIKP